MRMAETRLHVGGGAPYDVVVGRDVLGSLAGLLPGAQRVAVIHSGSLAPIAARVAAQLDGFEVLPVVVPEGETAKTSAVAVSCWDALGAAGFTRSDAVVAVGGGATTDLGGFVAATWLRGVRVVHVSTSVLGMVDAAVGGKTGIDTDAGKNLVGSFHEPAGVICDLSLLATLPRAELISGLGEVIKCGFIADPEILALVEKEPSAALDPASAVLRELIERAIAVKIAVVVDDLTERRGSDEHPGRETLNYGHTLAHALERATGYKMRHGEAVSVGMCFVAELARRVGRIDDALAARHASTLASVGLPTSFTGHDFDSLLATMRLDKKTRGNTLRFVVLNGLAQPRILSGPSEDDLRASYEVIAR